MDEFLGRVDRRLIHHLHAARNDARADDLADAFAGVLRGGKPDKQRARAFRLFKNAHGHLGHHAEQPFGAVDDPEEVIAAGIQMLAANAHDLTVHEHDLAAEHVVGGHAVFEAMYAAGIFRHIAADGAGDLR